MALKSTFVLIIILGTYVYVGYLMYLHHQAKIKDVALKEADPQWSRVKLKTRKI